MLAKVTVLPPDEFKTQYENQFDTGGGDPVANGQKIFESRGCTACHTTDGTPKVGPTLKGVFGRTETLADGSTVKVDENYIRESLLNPQAKIVQGYPATMPTFQGLLMDKDIDAIIAFLKTKN